MAAFLRIDKAQLKQIMPRITDAYAEAFVSHQHQLDKYGITANKKRYAMWIANVAHESGEFHEMQENGNYRAETIVRTWPSRFKSVAAAAPYAHNPAKLFNNVYANRMGNGPSSSGDGYNYRGRGEPQVTGKDGYKNVGRVSGLPLLAHPDAAIEMETMNEVGGAFWQWKDLNRLADAGNHSAVVGRWNGGHIGMAQREAYLRKATAVLAKVGFVAAEDNTPVTGAEPIASVPLPEPRPSMPDDAPQVHEVPQMEMEAAQRKLQALGYFPGNPDGDGGTLTRDALLSFQADNSLPTTGTLDDATWQQLQVAGPKHIPESRATATADTLREKGSVTVSLADKLKGYGKWLIGGGLIGTAGDESSPLEKLQSGLDQASYLRTFIEPMREAWQFAKDHEFLILVLAGVAIYFVAHEIIKNRVDDEQTGANRGR